MRKRKLSTGWGDQEAGRLHQECEAEADISEGESEASRGTVRAKAQAGGVMVCSRNSRNASRICQSAIHSFVVCSFVHLFIHCVTSTYCSSLCQALSGENTNRAESLPSRSL